MGENQELVITTNDPFEKAKIKLGSTTQVRIQEQHSNMTIFEKLEKAGICKLINYRIYFYYIFKYC